MALVNFVYAATATAEQKAAFNADTLYFIADEKAIYKGTTLYASAKAGNVEIADTDGLLTATTVEGALAELAGSITDAGSNAEITVETPASSSYAAVYELYQGLTGEETAEQKASKKVGTINIPKDMVVQSGTVETVTTADTPYSGAAPGDKYIDIVLANAANDHIYIPANALVDTYTGSGTAGTDELLVTVSNGVIGATVDHVDGTKVKYNTTTTIVQKVDAVEAAITTAVEALDADLDVTGTPAKNGTMVVTGVTEVDGKITALDATEVEAAGAAAAVLGASGDAATANTVFGAKAYADSLLTWGSLA